MDSMVTSDDGRYGRVSKGKITKEYLIAAAGSAQDVMAFIDWAEDGYKLTEANLKKYGLYDRDVEVEGIIVDRKHRVLVFESRLYPMPIESPFHALGSGWKFAFGAMALGASPYTAVKIASEYDVNTGGNIKLLAFRKQKVKRVAKTDT